MRSRDGGTHWEHVTGAPAEQSADDADSDAPQERLFGTALDVPLIAPAYAGATPVFVFGGMPDSASLYRSTDAGTSWQVVRSGLDRPRLVLSPNFERDGRIWLIDRKGKLSWSPDGGTTWLQVEAPLGLAVRQLLVSPNVANDRMLFAVAGDPSVAEKEDGRLLVSADYGDSWTETRLSLGDGTPILGRIKLLTVSPTFATDATLLALVQPHVDDPSPFYVSNIAPVIGDLYVSGDAGASWQAYGPPPSHPNARSGRDESPEADSIALSPLYALDGTAVVSLEDQGGGAVIICTTYRTSDAGATWVQDNNGDTHTHRCGETVLATLQNEIVLIHSIGDVRWKSSVEVPSELLGSLFIHPPFVVRNGAVFVGGPGAILELSREP
jgi:photosystem II stability/assembly factor-like uncharacterized protein